VRQKVFSEKQIKEVKAELERRFNELLEVGWGRITIDFYGDRGIIEIIAAPKRRFDKI